MRPIYWWMLFIALLLFLYSLLPGCTTNPDHAVLDYSLNNKLARTYTEIEALAIGIQDLYERDLITDTTRKKAAEKLQTAQDLLDEAARFLRDKQEIEARAKYETGKILIERTRRMVENEPRPLNHGTGHYAGTDVLAC